MYFNSDFRLILSNKLSSKNNTLIDKALFKYFNDYSLPILRIYSWQKCITFGAGQDPYEFENLLKDYEYNFSKRITGGGVLFHGHDISYSLIFSSKLTGELSVKQTYEFVCSFIINFYNSLGLNADFAKNISEITLSKNKFCQVGFEAYDIIINNKKIGGNAQKRAKNIIFQHGSIPLKKVSNDEKLGVSLEDFSIFFDFKETILKLKDSFEDTFKTKLIKSELNEKEEQILNDLSKE